MLFLHVLRHWPKQFFVKLGAQLCAHCAPPPAIAPATVSGSTTDAFWILSATFPTEKLQKSALGAALESARSQRAEKQFVCINITFDIKKYDLWL